MVETEKPSEHPVTSVGDALERVDTLLPHLDPKKPTVAGVAGTTARVLLGRFLMVRALGYLALGAVCLTAAWQLVASVRQRGDQLATLSARGVATVGTSWWTLDLDPDLASQQKVAWFLHEELCSRFRLLHPAAGTTTVVCRRTSSLPEGPLLVDSRELDPLLPTRWADAQGRPRLDLRFTPRAYRWLEKQPAANWPLLPQDDAARTSAPPRGSELDALLLRADLPVELLLADWGPEATAEVPMRVDPQHPTQALPETIAEQHEVRWTAFVPAAVAGGVGLLAWIAGSVLLLVRYRPIWRTAFLLATLALLPWWGQLMPRLAHLFLSAKQAQGLGTLLASGFVDQTPPCTFGIHAGEAPVDVVRRSVTLDDSYYADVLSPLALRRPVTVGSDDDLLQQLVGQADARLQGMPDSALVPWLGALDRHLRLAARGADLLLLDGVRRLSLDDRRGNSITDPAAREVVWLAGGPGPVPGQRAETERRELWRALADYPDALVRDLAQKSLAPRTSRRH